MDSIYEVADQYVTEATEHSPVLKTFLGIPGANHEWGLSGLDAHEERARHAERYLQLIAPHRDSEDPDAWLAANVMDLGLNTALLQFDHLDHLRDLRHLGSQFGLFRSIFDVMPKRTESDWDDVGSRLRTLDEPLDGYRQQLQAGIDSGEVVAKRQVESIIRQARKLASDGSPYLLLVAQAEAQGQDTAGLTESATQARSSMGEFADWLESTYLPEADREDAVGIERYERAADAVLGMAIDAHETYRWGWEEFNRLVGEMRRVADVIVPGASVLEVKDFLESDPETTVQGTDALLEFVKGSLDDAVEKLAGEHFDVPEDIKPLTVQLASPGGPLGVYYLRPSEDLSRPGGVWYAIGDQKVFPTYQHLSTAYHEGFPGHHLQIATATYGKDRLTRYQRTMMWYPGFGEGWAMYAEVLMGELGFLSDPKFYFGMLAKQLYRASRVVVDIGLHLRLAIDSSSPTYAGEPWSFERAVDFMETYGFRTRDQARDEVLRYLGWPAQAISYKVGERAILDLRSAMRRQLGADFELRRFHKAVIGHGTVPLGLLSEVVEKDLSEG